MINRGHGALGSAVRVFLSHFVVSSFIGLMLVQVLHHAALKLGLDGKLHHKLVIAFLTGLIVAAIMGLLHIGKVRRLNIDVYSEDDSAYRRASIGSGFVCGALVILAYENLFGLLIVTGLAVLSIALNVKLFFRRVGLLIRPDRYAHIVDVVFLVSVFVTLLFAFTLINYTIDNIYSVLAASQDFDTTGEAFTAPEDPDAPRDSSVPDGNLPLLDYLYFSVVLMTTLGFGDISPIKGVAKIAVSLECLMSYVMFALMVGVITRGIIFRDEDETEPAEEP